MRRPFVLPLFVLALAIRSSAETRQAGNPGLKYYADAYADHYGVPRALVHAIIAQESNWNPHALSRSQTVLIEALVDSLTHLAKFELYNPPIRFGPCPNKKPFFDQPVYQMRGSTHRDTHSPCEFTHYTFIPLSEPNE
jgi:hypothetical protein